MWRIHPKQQTSSGKRYARTSSAQEERNVPVIPAKRNVLQSALAIIVDMSMGREIVKELL